MGTSPDSTRLDSNQGLFWLTRLDSRQNFSTRLFFQQEKPNFSSFFFKKIYNIFWLFPTLFFIFFAKFDRWIWKSFFVVFVRILLENSVLNTSFIFYSGVESLTRLDSGLVLCWLDSTRHAMSLLVPITRWDCVKLQENGSCCNLIFTKAHSPLPLL